MEYVTLKGFNDGMLYYIPADGHLYVRKYSKNSKIYLSCYERCLTKKFAKNNPSFQLCPAKVHLDTKTNLCYRTNAPHTSHDDHELKYRDLQSLNGMKDHCRFLAKHFPFSCHKIPIKEIFLLEIAK